MFQDASDIDRRSVDRRIAALREGYDAVAESWFDGSPDSVDRRIAACDQILVRARNAAVRLGYQEGYTEIVAELEEDKKSLTDLRQALLNGDREEYRTAAQPGTKADYLDFARSQQKDPQALDTASMYAAMMGIPMEAIGRFLESHRTAEAGRWGDVDVDMAESIDPSPAGENLEQYIQYSLQNGLDPSDPLSADRFSRERGIPRTLADDMARDFGRGRRASLSPTQLKSLELNSRTFLADNQDCLSFSPELRYRAERYAKAQPCASEDYVKAFVDRVGRIAATLSRREHRIAHKKVTAFSDFPAELLYE